MAEIEINPQDLINQISEENKKLVLELATVRTAISTVEAKINDLDNSIRSNDTNHQENSNG